MGFSKDDEEIIFVSVYDIMNSPEYLHYQEVISKFRYDLSRATNYFKKLKAIGEFYKSSENEILRSASKGLYYNSYPCDWTRIFTPIEMQAWESIRSKGRIVFYPQYPVLEYFIDFANPYLKIGLELNGKAFHTDKSKDFIRDMDLRRQGWTIYRITGAEMTRSNYKEWWEIEDMDYEDDKIQALRHWLLNTGDGVIEAIKTIHFTGYHDPEDDQVQERFISFCHQTLENHRSN